MSGKISDMRNLGPKTEYMLAEVDIHNEADLREVGAVDAYHRLKFRFGRHISLLALYAMHAAILGCDWRSLSDQEKSDLHDAVK